MSIISILVYVVCFLKHIDCINKSNFGNKNIILRVRVSILLQSVKCNFLGTAFTNKVLVENYYSALANKGGGLQGLQSLLGRKFI